MYASTRMLYSMSKSKLAFEAFGKTNKNGVPDTSLLVTAIIVANNFRITKPYKKVRYQYIVAASGLNGFIAEI